jgi:hypothetical protein
MGSRVTRGRAVFFGVAALAAGSVGACVLADPPAALPVTPIEPPEILRDSVTPPLAFPLLYELPPQFTIPVSVDPRETEITYTLVLDQGVPQPHNLSAEEGGVIVVVDEPPELVAEECHTFEVRVSYPAAAGSDSVVWFYSPTQSFANCPVYDAGPGDSGEDSAGGGD